MTVPPILSFSSLRVWNTEQAYQLLEQLGLASSKRTAERRLHETGFLPLELKSSDLLDEQGKAPTPSVMDSEIARSKAQRKLVLFGQLKSYEGQVFLHANDARGGRYWIALEGGTDAANGVANGAANTAANIAAALEMLQAYVGKPLTLFPHAALVAPCREIDALADVDIALLSYPSRLNLESQKMARHPARATASETLTHLDRLEAESIAILREAVAQAENPAMLYSIGKDSSVMLHLARKAFFPAPPPFPLLHVDTRWKFHEMYLFRDEIARSSGMELLIHINPEAIEKNINPFDHGSSVHTDITKTVGLKQALDQYQFDVVFGGARRDEEKSRAKERIFSFRSQNHRWDPKSQRPELWNLYNARKNKGESIRVFPLSNWTELDIWQYIYRESIPIVPLYFAKPRPVVVRDGMMIMVDDARMRLLEHETIECRTVRFRTLGCYPLTGAVGSQAASLPEIILELLDARTSERQGRAIDLDSSGSMERKKQEGYF